MTSRQRANQEAKLSAYRWGHITFAQLAQAIGYSTAIKLTQR